MIVKKHQFGIREFLSAISVTAVLLAVSNRAPHAFLMLSTLPAICGFVLLVFAGLSMVAWLCKPPGSGREFRKQQCLHLFAYGVASIFPLVLYLVSRLAV